MKDTNVLLKISENTIFHLSPTEMKNVFLILVDHIPGLLHFLYSLTTVAKKITKILFPFFKKSKVNDIYFLIKKKTTLSSSCPQQFQLITS